MMNGIVNNIVTGSIGLLVLAGVLVGVTAFQATQVPAVATATCNISGTGVITGCSSAFQVSSSINSMAQNFGSQLPTVGTMFGVAIILAAIGLIGYGIAMGVKRD